MASENETVDDIVKEKRDTADEAELKGKNTFSFDLAKMLREEANRIEAAHKREVAELRKGISELLDALQEIYDEECTSYGTGEVYDKWRKALKGAIND